MAAGELRSHWAPDSAIHNCVGCHKRFDQIRRKHHCRLCGQIFCEACCGQKLHFAPYKLDDGRGCNDCNLLLSRHIPLMQRQTAFLLYPASGAPRRRVVGYLDEGMENFFFETPEEARRPKNALLDDAYSVSEFTSIVDGQNSVSFRRAVRRSEPGCFSFMFGGGEDIRVYAPCCFSVVFSVSCLDLQADTAALKGEWMTAAQAFFDHVTSPGGLAFRAEMIDDRNRRQAEEMRKKSSSVVSQRRDNNPRIDSIREKYRPSQPAASSSSGYRPLPPGIEELSFDS